MQKIDFFGHNTNMEAPEPKQHQVVITTTIDGVQSSLTITIVPGQTNEILVGRFEPPQNLEEVKAYWDKRDEQANAQGEFDGDSEESSEEADVLCQRIAITPGGPQELVEGENIPHPQIPYGNWCALPSGDAIVKVNVNKECAGIQLLYPPHTQPGRWNRTIYEGGKHIKLWSERRPAPLQHTIVLRGSPRFTDYGEETGCKRVEIDIRIVEL